MPKFYIKWQRDTTKVPAEAEQRVKSELAMLEMAKADMKAGVLKDWGCAAGGYRGYGICEAASETEVFTLLLKWMPNYQFEVVPVLTVDQTIESIKKAITAEKK